MSYARPITAASQAAWDRWHGRLPWRVVTRSFALQVRIDLDDDGALWLTLPPAAEYAHLPEHMRHDDVIVRDRGTS